MNASPTIVSVWKWTGTTWSVYLPGEGTPGTYAASKGFGQLTTIGAGEGFWVNSTGVLDVSLTGTPASGGLSLAVGWNLVGLKGTVAKTVSALVVEPEKIISLWKWEGSTWSVHLPGEATPGSYAASKGFGVLATINPSEGFWVNAKEAMTLP